LVPPVAGRRERRSAVVRNVFLLIWSVFLAVAFLLPGTWLYDRAMELMDRAFWPVVVAWGKPAAVAVVAGGLAVLTMLVQRLLTDNRRLRVAKRRAARLRALAARLPQDSPRRKAMEALAKPVQPRVVMASMVPLAVLLGPIVVPFLWWFPARVDPAAWNPEPGVMAFVTAAVDGEFTAPVSIDCDADLTLDERTPASQSLPPIRNILEDRLGEWQRESDMTKLPWQVQEAGQLVGKALLDDLTQYLQQDLPPQTLTWNVVTPKDTAGRFRVAVTPAGGEPVEVHLTIGDASPPEPTEDLGDGKLVQVVRAADAHSPVKYVKVTYEQRPQPAFWAPFSGLGWSWDAGWLLLYIVVYLPVMLVSRWVLRLP
jgi:pyruvate,water dikinase